MGSCHTNVEREICFIFFPVINRMRSEHGLGGTNWTNVWDIPPSNPESDCVLCQDTEMEMGKGWELPAELRAQVGFVIIVRYVSTNTLQNK